MQLMDLKRSLEISPRILTGRELMKVNAIYEANNFFFFTSTLRDIPSIDIDDIGGKKLQCWTFKVSKFHRCNNSVLLLLS